MLVHEVRFLCHIYTSFFNIIFFITRPFLALHQHELPSQFTLFHFSFLAFSISFSNSSFFLTSIIVMIFLPYRLWRFLSFFFVLSYFLFFYLYCFPPLYLYCWIPLFGAVFKRSVIQIAPA